MQWVPIFRLLAEFDRNLFKHNEPSSQQEGNCCFWVQPTSLLMLPTSVEWVGKPLSRMVGYTKKRDSTLKAVDSLYSLPRPIEAS